MSILLVWGCLIIWPFEVVHGDQDTSVSPVALKEMRSVVYFDPLEGCPDNRTGASDSDSAGGTGVIIDTTSRRRSWSATLSELVERLASYKMSFGSPSGHFRHYFLQRAAGDDWFFFYSVDRHSLTSQDAVSQCEGFTLGPFVLTNGPRPLISPSLGVVQPQSPVLAAQRQCLPTAVSSGLVGPSH